MLEDLLNVLLMESLAFYKEENKEEQDNIVSKASNILVNLKEYLHRKDTGNQAQAKHGQEDNAKCKMASLLWVEALKVVDETEQWP